MIVRGLFTLLVFLLVAGLTPAGLLAKTHYWSAHGTEISYQIDIHPEWQSSKKQKFNYGSMTFRNSRMRIFSESFSQPSFETVEQTIMRRIARLAVLGKIKKQTEPKQLKYKPWPYIYEVHYVREGKTIRNLEALWHFYGGRRIVRVVCSAAASLFEKDRHECWNAILSVSAINMDDKAVPQFQQLALETKGRFYKTKTPDEIADRLMDIGNSLATTGAGGGLDIVFVVDNTGSMGDSIEVVKGKIREFITASKGKHTQIRYGLVQYRDAGDDFVTRVTPFTSDTAAFESAVSAMSAQGGGDWPEAMLDAIYVAATKMQWQSQRRVMILLGDAPGHEKVVEAPSSVTWTNIIPTLRGSGIDIHVYSVYATLDIGF